MFTSKWKVWNTKHFSWMADDITHVSSVDLTTNIKNCKILVALVSDNFERDQKCNDLLIYAKETLNKEVIVVVMGTSMDWLNKDLGIRIGQQEVSLKFFYLHIHLVTFWWFFFYLYLGLPDLIWKMKACLLCFGAFQTCLYISCVYEVVSY